MRVAAGAAGKVSGGGGDKQAWYEQLIKGGGKVSLMHYAAGRADAVRTGKALAARGLPCSILP